MLRLTEVRPPAAMFSSDPQPGGKAMRLVVAGLIVVAIVYYWDVEYNHGILADGLASMLRSISHSMAP
jgi:hypothetical protein